MSASLYDALDAVAARFGADLEQVRRDHLLSHVLAAISAGVSTDDVVFFGGTALSRTYLADARLSEDIDLNARRPGRRSRVRSKVTSSATSQCAGRIRPMSRRHDTC